MLSRIDGQTPWALLRQIGGLPPEEADRMLEAWVESGLVMLDSRRDLEARPRNQDATGHPAGNPDGPSPEPEGEDEAAIDRSLDLDPAFQREILAFEQKLDIASYHEILGVDRGADARAIKLAYFRLSKLYHPDRYFRRKIGDFGARFESIFKRVVEAYELLSDPTTRTEIERSMPAASGPVAPEEGSYREAQTGRTELLGGPERGPGYRTPTRLENLERLRRRFKMPKKILAERQFKARQFFQAAKVAAHQRSWLEAAASARLAIAFDPWNRAYKEGFAEIQAEVHRVRAGELLEGADSAASQEEALRLLEEALHYRPSDPELNVRAARLALESDHVDRALEYAENACELAPDAVESHVLHCRALRRSDRVVEAREALARAVSIAPKHPDVLSEQRLMKRGPVR